ncbi:MAG: DUF3656 domain-containing protein [Peptococcaceae bacterium]|nr:DUF3656 domain-containing protein [Peptococcaceae bacterium]
MYDQQKPEAVQKAPDARRGKAPSGGVLGRASERVSHRRNAADGLFGQPHKPELLAPAGSWEALVAAVENGADAVYLGGRMFNARQSAANFDDGELSRAVEYAHLRGVKIYVTVNILISDGEMEEALEFLFRLQNLGADAAIIQDAGLAALARRVLPELPLHASTQMTAHNTPAVRKLVEDGFSRVVLAREMSLDGIREVKKATGAELEAFIHGALCISYSGQCLLSSMIGGRSGNRGRCAQPCRMQYALLGREGGPAADPSRTGEYLLSPRDLNISAHIPELIAAGIDSFKIEGRMKRPEYVATVVRIYRGLIDRALSGRPYRVEKAEEEDLAQIFNRDFTTGYFFGRQGREMMSYKRPNNRGVRLGRVRGTDRKSGLVEVALERPLRTGDGLEVWVTEGGRAGFTVNEIFVRGKKVERAAAGEVAGLSVPGRARPGDRVFKTHDAGLMDRARESFASPRGARRKVPVHFHVQAGPGSPLVLTAAGPGGRTASAATGSAGRPADKRPLDEDFLSQQLGRLGNTPFEMTALTCDIRGRVIYPVSEINRARREVLAELEEKILGDRRRPPVDRDVFRSRLERELGKVSVRREAAGRTRPLLAVSVGDIGSLKRAVTAGADVVYFGPGQFRSKPPVDRESLVQAAGICAGNRAVLVLATPRITGDFEIEELIELFQGIPAGGVLAGNLGLLAVLAERIPGLPAVADFGLNAFNRHTVEYLAGLGAARVTLSPELTMEQVRELAGKHPVEVLVQGALELMVSEHCLPGAVLGEDPAGGACRAVCRKGGYRLRDRTGALFPVETDWHCRMHVFNSRDLCLVDDIPELALAGVDCVRIEARRETPEYVTRTVEIYRKALDGLSDGESGRPDPEEARERLLALSPAGLTKGHFYRGV